MADRTLRRLGRVTDLRRTIEERRLAALLAGAEQARLVRERAANAAREAEDRRRLAEADRNASPACGTRRLWLDACAAAVTLQRARLAEAVTALDSAEAALDEGRRRFERLRLRADRLADRIRAARRTAARDADTRIEEDWNDARRSGMRA